LDPFNGLGIKLVSTNGETGEDRRQPDPSYLVSEGADGARSANQQTEAPKNTKETPNFFQKWGLRPIKTAISWLDHHDGIVTAIATVAIAYLTFSLADDSRRQAKTASDQFRIMQGQLDQMTSSTASTKALAEAAKIEGNIVESANRAWIDPLFITLKLPLPKNPGDKLNYVIWYINSGKNPALHLREYHHHFWTDADNSQFEVLTPDKFVPNDSCEKVTEENGSGVIWPRVEGTSANSLGPYSKEVIIADDAFLQGNKFLGIRGCFAYDAFGKSHFSAYCFFLRPTQTDASVRATLDNWSWGYCPGVKQNFAD
jgi:hypothetical protein